MDFFSGLLRGGLGMAVLLFLCYLLSQDRKAINWRTVSIGLILQIILGLLILKVPVFKDIFSGIASFFVVLLDFTEAGADFVLGDWPEFVAYEDKAAGGVVRIGYIFAFKVLPTIVFFSAFSSLLYFLGILQLFIKGFAWVMAKTMNLTGAESLAAAANVFIGQTEAPLVVKPYLEKMSRSEMLCLMTGGMATIAGGVFAAYVGFLGGDDPVLRQAFATHLLTASIMSAPAAIIAAKILLPESKKVNLADQNLDIPKQEVGSNILDAISRGTTDGIKLAVNVGAMLLVFTAFISMVNYIFVNGLGTWTGLNDWVVAFTDGRFNGFSLDFLLGMVFAPIAWTLGVPWEDATLVGQLLGLKTTLNEFFAYAALEGMQADLTEKSIIIATYALCGFANFASIGIQIGGIGAIAPGQRKNLTELGLLSLVGGTVACFFTAITAGIMFTPSPEIESGVSLNMAIERAQQVDQLQYDIRLDIPNADQDTIRGEMTIRFDWEKNKNDLQLDFRQASSFLKSIEINGNTVEPAVIQDHILLPANLLEAEANEVKLSFLAGDMSLNRNPEYLYSLFVPDRASTAFPFFDQPDLKARYTLVLETPADWEAMANGPLLSKDLNGERAIFKFKETKAFSTYVFAFVAGKFKKMTKTLSGREMSMLYRESDEAKVQRNADAIFDLHAKSLAWLEEYTTMEMPFQKFDFALIPGFQYGGMEHIGAIFYRESSLMLDEGATKNRLMSRASLIAHETAHMWFGDLVTMKWFNDVWLKEVFANFMAAKIVHPSFPEINHDLRFLLAHHPAALGEDRSEGSHPIQQDLDNLKNAGTLYGRIIYQKAPIVMRQLETLIGEAALREGLQEYLNNFAFGNATWDDLINILDQKTDEDLKEWSELWVKVAGVPEFRPEWEIQEGKMSNPKLLQTKADAQGRYWSQLTKLALIYEDTIIKKNLKLEGEETVIPDLEGKSEALAFIPNATPMTYGYFQLDEKSKNYLLSNASSLKDPVLRGVAWLNLEENMLNGKIAPDVLLNSVIKALESEQEILNRQRLLGLCSSLFWRYLSEDKRAAYAQKIEPLLWSALEQAADAGSKYAYWSSYLGLAYSEKAKTKLLAIWKADESIPGLKLSEPRRYNLATTLAIKVPGEAQAVLDELATEIKNPDRKRRLAFVRPALSSDQKIRDEFFDSLKEEGNRAMEPWVGEGLRYLHHPLRAKSAIKYVQPSLALMEEIQATGDIFFPRQWISSTLGGHNSPEAAQLVKNYLNANPKFSDRLKNKVLMAADPLFRASGTSLND